MNQRSKFIALLLQKFLMWAEEEDIDLEKVSFRIYMRKNTMVVWLRVFKMSIPIVVSATKVNAAKWDEIFTPVIVSRMPNKEEGK